MIAPRSVEKRSVEKRVARSSNVTATRSMKMRVGWACIGPEPRSLLLLQSSLRSQDQNQSRELQWPALAPLVIMSRSMARRVVRSKGLGRERIVQKLRHVEFVKSICEKASPSSRLVAQGLSKSSL